MRRRRIVICAVVFVLTVAGWAAYHIVSAVRSVPDAYAAWDTGTLIIEYLDTHDGKWPRSWDDLRAAAASAPKHNRTLYGAGAYHDLPSRVRVDWEADPKEIARAECREGTPPVHVVTRVDGTDFRVVWVGAEPNEMIWDYLRRHDSK